MHYITSDGITKMEVVYHNPMRRRENAGKRELHKGTKWQKMHWKNGESDNIYLCLFKLSFAACTGGGRAGTFELLALMVKQTAEVGLPIMFLLFFCKTDMA